jgi:cytoskeletal protein CcmA (bactofilin family)
VAKIEGEVVTTGTVKVGTGSVIIGNISASSAVIAGAVKGDIDVQGPVVVDTSAVIMGNIKSRSVQINNGAVIEGFCSQCYADIDVQGLFEAR